MAPIFISGHLLAGDIVVSQFGGLDTQDSPAALKPYQAQDLLNVVLQPGMQSVFKRDGYGLFQSLPIACSTCAVHGGYHFQQTGGSDVQLWGNDKNLSGSVSDASFVAVATGTVGATWQCTDNLGFAYCVDSSNDTPVKTDGTKTNTTYMASTVPLGTMVTSTPLQLVIAGVSGNPSSIYFSANNSFGNFVTGPLSTDPYIEIINAPGSRITHIAYYFGKVFWWKDQSFGFLSNSGSQYTVTVTIVSNQIGTIDNSSAFWNPTTYESANAFSTNVGPSAYGGMTQAYNSPQFTLGGIFFRGQDNHIYQYDGYTLTRLTRIIEPTIQSANRRKANQWVQNTTAQFNAGTVSPSNNLVIAANSIATNNFSQLENSSAQWGSGTNTNMTINASSIQLATNNSGNITNPDFESAFSGNWTDSDSNFSRSGNLTTNCGSVNPQSGSFMAAFSIATAVCSSITESIDVIDLNNNILQTGTQSPVSCTWTIGSITPTAAQIGKRMKVRLHINYCGTDEYLTTSDSYIWGGALSFYYNMSTTAILQEREFDNIQNGSSTIATGSFTSQVYNTGVSSAIYQISQFAYTQNAETPTFDLQTAPAASGPWTEILNSSGTNSSFSNGYVKYTTTMSVINDNAVSAITSVNIIAQSSGTYYSAINNAPKITSWNTFLTVQNTPGNSSIAYYTRTASTTWVVSASTWPVWVSQPINTFVTASTNTYMQARADFGITAATEAPSLSNFTFNWYEGTASDKAYITYFKDAIWIAESSGTATSTDDVVYYLDLLNNAWLQFTIPANGFAVENNSLYFGDPVQGRVFKFGSVTTDNTAAIQAYWKSKDFAGDDPTVQNQYMQSDFIFAQANSTVTYTPSIDQVALTATSIPTGNATAGIVKRGFLMPVGKIGVFYNFKVGDNTGNAAWKMLFHKEHYNPLNWRPQTS